MKQLGLSWQGMMTSKRAVELKLQSLNFPLYSAFVPTAEDMKLSPRAFHRKMCSGQDVAGRGAGSEFNFWSEQQREGLSANA